MCAQTVASYVKVKYVLSSFSFYEGTAPVDQGSFGEKHAIEHWDVRIYTLWSQTFLGKYIKFKDNVFEILSTYKLYIDLGQMN